MAGNTQNDQPAVDHAMRALSLSSDFMLEQIVISANFGQEFPVTLLTGGMLVSGRVVSGRKFVQHMLSDLVSTVSNDEVRSQLNEAFSEHLENYPESGEPVEGKVITYIHLSDAKFFNPAGTKPIPTGGTGVFWRGKIAAVDGFNFGILGVSA